VKPKAKGNGGRKMDFETKIKVVLRDDLEMWQIIEGL
jgi:hypothetical protein